MKFLLDACVSSRSLQNFLVRQGHDVLSAVTVDPHAPDERLMAVALKDGRILVTADKDFGHLIFVRRLPHGPVELTVDEQLEAMAELLDHHAADLTGPVLVTVTRGRIRIRR